MAFSKAHAHMSLRVHKGGVYDHSYIWVAATGKKSPKHRYFLSVISFKNHLLPFPQKRDENQNTNVQK